MTYEEELIQKHKNFLKDKAKSYSDKFALEELKNCSRAMLDITRRMTTGNRSHYITLLIELLRWIEAIVEVKKFDNLDPTEVLNDIKCNIASVPSAAGIKSLLLTVETYNQKVADALKCEYNIDGLCLKCEYKRIGLRSID